MKKSIFAICVILLVLLSGCDVSEKSTGNTEHIHQWQEVSGEHARICTECREKQLKPEACDCRIGESFYGYGFSLHFPGNTDEVLFGEGNCTSAYVPLVQAYASFDDFHTRR